MKNVTILIADGTPDLQGDVIDVNGIELPKEVPLTHGFYSTPETFLGKAYLRKEGDRIVADLEFVTDRIPAELRKHCYPAIAGYIVERDGAIIKRCRINQLSISVEANVDPRISKLTE